MRKLALLTASFFATAAVYAQAAGSNDTMKAGLLQFSCSPPPGISVSDREFAEQTCNSYLRGLTDGLYLMKTFIDKGQQVCMPGDQPVPIEKAKTLLNGLLAARPDMAGNSAGLVTAFAIIKVYPCR